MRKISDHRIDALREAIRQDIGWDDRNDAIIRTRDGFRLRLDVRGVETNLLPLDGKTGEDRAPTKVASAIVDALLHASVMREGDTLGPPAAIIAPPGIIGRMMDHVGVDRQDLMDRAWWAMIELTGGADTEVAWRTRNPTILAQRPEPSLSHIGRKVRFDLTDCDAYLSGVITPRGMSVSSIVTADGRVAVRVAANSVTMSVTDRFPETVLTGLKGRRLDEVVSIPTLAGEHIVISAVRPAKDFTTFHLDGWFVIDPIPKRPQLPPHLNIVAALEGPAADLLLPPLRP